MAAVILPPITSSEFPIDTSLKAKIESPSIHQINKQLNAEGRTKIGEKALEESLQKLSEIFQSKDVKISAVFDAQQGIRQLKITDASGKSYMEMPPEAAIKIADNAKQKHIGWLIDLVI